MRSRSETDQHHFVTNGKPSTITIFLFLSVFQLYFSHFLNCIYRLNISISQYLKVTIRLMRFKSETDQHHFVTNRKPSTITIFLFFSLSQLYLLSKLLTVSISHSLNSANEILTDQHHLVKNQHSLFYHFHSSSPSS